MKDLWAERRRAILLAADALEARDTRAWSEVDELLFQVRSARPAEAQTLLAKDAPKRVEAWLDEEAVETFPLPFPKLNDCLLGGLRRGQTAIIAADPAHGKSILVDQILEHLAKRGARCHLFLNEMTPADRTARWVQRRTGILEAKVLARELDDSERKAILSEAESFPFDMTQVAGDSPMEIANRIRDCKADVVALDLLSRLGYQNERELRLAVTMLTDAAHQANCVLILLHHLNEKRVHENGARPTPSLTDIRDSGSVKNFSDLVFFLHRNVDEDEPTRLLSTGAFYAVKVRAGKPGGVRVRLNTGRLRFDLLPDE